MHVPRSLYRPMHRPVARLAVLLGAALALAPGTALSITADAEPTASPTTSDELVVTPSQGEGPYYPVELPEDRDADLTFVEGAAAPALGEVLLIEGLLLTSDGLPVEGATVEIWQTDAGGVYLHPQDPGMDGRDPGFQGYGESVTDAAGAWAFRTILPEVYGGRPRHIHAKVRVGEETMLTTQVYFSGGDIPEAGAVTPTGTDLDTLVVEAHREPGPDGTDVLTAHHRLVLP